MDPKEVKQRAKQVSDLAMDYHLSNVVFACYRIAQVEFKVYINKKRKSLNERLLAAEKANDTDQYSIISREIRQLRPPFGIFVEYIKKGKGRVIFLAESNRFIITLPKDLLAESRNSDGVYNPQGLKKLRWLISHEIGHIALQTKDISEIISTQGTITLGENKEAERDADIFAKELLALQHKHYEKLFNSGMWEAF